MTLLCKIPQTTSSPRYVYGPNIDEPIRLERGGQICYYHFDGLGSVTDLSNNLGQHIEHYVYSPFGKTKIYDPATGLKRDDSVVGNYYRFTARQWDGEGGLYYYRARMYDPSLGRFLQTDPVGYDADINLYRYCSNNPLNRTDPLGLDSNSPNKRPDETWDDYWKRKRAERDQRLNEQKRKRAMDLLNKGMIGAFLRSLGYTGSLLGDGIAYAGDGTVTIPNPTASGILNKILTGGAGALLIGIGIAVDAPFVIVAGGALVLYVGAKTIMGWINLPDKAQSIAVDIYDETGLKGHYDEIEDLGRQMEEINR